MKNQEQNDTKIDVQEHLREQFQELGEEVTTPTELKKEVFNTLNTLTLFGDILDLFTTKFTQSELNVIDSISRGIDND